MDKTKHLQHSAVLPRCQEGKNMNYATGYQIPPEPPREVWPYVCDICGEECNADEIECYGLDIVCQDCKDNYLHDHAEEYVGEYVAHSGLAYLRDWWLGSMEESERNAVLLAALQSSYAACEQLSKSIGDTGLNADRMDFCTSSPGFWDYVENKLKEE